MTREHIVRLTVLTACIFAFSIFMQKDTWIFPFPLYESAMLLAMLALFIADKKNPGFIGGAALVWALLQVCLSGFVLEFFISGENVHLLNDRLFTDYLPAAFVLFFALWGVLVSLRLQQQQLKIAAISCVAVFAVLLYNEQVLWAMLPLTAWLACLFVDEKGRGEGSIHRNILFLFTFFFLSKYGTLALLGN